MVVSCSIFGLLPTVEPALGVSTCHLEEPSHQKVHRCAVHSRGLGVHKDFKHGYSFCRSDAISVCQVRLDVGSCNARLKRAWLTLPDKIDTSILRPIAPCHPSTELDVEAHRFTSSVQVKP